MKVFLELRDVHYPGSTYTLTYEPGERSAQGRLLPGCPQQRFAMVFVRMQ